MLWNAYVFRIWIAIAYILKHPEVLHLYSYLFDI